MVYRCDRCGKIIERPLDEEPLRFNICYGRADYDDPDDGGVLTSIDVCQNCYNNFLFWKSMYQMEAETDGRT